jgi:predicted neutral ceramidase superfamily lipid hydrolase
VAIFLAVALPVRLLMVAVEVAIEGPSVITPRLITSPAMVAVQMHAETQTMPVTAGILFLIAPLLLGLILGASAHAFAALKGNKPGGE